MDAIQKMMPDAEIIISDGGSTDNTLSIVEARKIKVVHSVRSRGIQLNKGASAASHEILCFLHADTFLPENTLSLLDNFFNESHNEICRFKLGFDVEHRLLNRYKYFSKYDSLFTRFGDMFVAMRKSFFAKVGGFPDWKIFEDVEFLRQASAISKIKILDAEVISSARTFTKYGLVCQQLFNGFSIMKYILGFRKFINEAAYYKRKPMKKMASIIVFARFPSSGKVKTRLASTAGNDFAVAFYKHVAENIISSASRISNAYKYIFYSDANEKEAVINWLGGKYFFCEQEGDDLGSRMKNAFNKVFGLGANKALIIGTDIPDLSQKIIEEAIAALDTNDIVIGPSNDGGYYLLGMKNYAPQLFEGIHYSTEKVFSETKNKIENLGLSCYVLKPLHDIDTEADLRKWFEQKTDLVLHSQISSIYTSQLKKG